MEFLGAMSLFSSRIQIIQVRKLLLITGIFILAIARTMKNKSHNCHKKNLGEEDSKIKFLFQPPNEI
jgi:hypothetical protein